MNYTIYGPVTLSVPNPISPATNIEEYEGWVDPNWPQEDFPKVDQAEFGQGDEPSGASQGWPYKTDKIGYYSETKAGKVRPFFIENDEIIWENLETLAKRRRNREMIEKNQNSTLYLPKCPPKELEEKWLGDFYPKKNVRRSISRRPITPSKPNEISPTILLEEFNLPPEPRPQEEYPKEDLQKEAEIYRNNSGVIKENVYYHSRFSHDPTTMTVKVGGREKQLTPRENALLRALTKTTNELRSTEDLTTEVWGEHYTKDNVKVHILSLRKKLEDKEEPSIIVSIRHLGYMLRDEIKVNNGS